MPRHHEVGAVTDEEILIDLDPLGTQPLDLLDQGDRIDNHAVADHADLSFPQNAGGDQVKYILLAAIHNGVAGVVASLAADDDIDSSGQDVDDLPFAFISPLGAYKNGVGHGVEAIGTKKPDQESGRVVKNRHFQRALQGESPLATL